MNFFGGHKISALTILKRPMSAGESGMDAKNISLVLYNTKLSSRVWMDVGVRVATFLHSKNVIDKLYVRQINAVSSGRSLMGWKM